MQLRDRRMSRWTDRCKWNITDYNLKIEGCTVTSAYIVIYHGVTLDSNLSFKNLK